MVDKDSTNNNNNYVVDVKVIDVEKRYGPGPKHYVYVIQVTWSNPANVFIIYRRYAQFFDLQVYNNNNYNGCGVDLSVAEGRIQECKLLDLFAEAPSPSNNYNSQSRQIPFLPGKIILGRSQIRQIAKERQPALDIYCQNIISLPERISRSRTVLEFFQPLPSDVQNPTEFPTGAKKLNPKDSISISGPSILPTYRCLSDFTAVEKTEMSLKRNTLVQVIHRHLNGWWFVQNGDRTGFVPGAFLVPKEPQNDVRETNTFSRSTNETYVVNKSYQAKTRDEISLDQGSFVTVLEKSFTGWWTIKFNDITGRFPAVCLTSCKGRTIPENVTRELSTTPSNTSIQRLSSLSNSDRNDYDAYMINTEPELFYVYRDFIDDVGDCVSLQRGDIVEIHEKHSSGWWLGRRLKYDDILSWIPSGFLQKEPIFDTYIDETHDPSAHSARYMNFTAEEQVPMDNIYENPGNQVSTQVIYTEVLQQEQSVGVKHTSLSSNNDNEKESTRTSVQDLVKKFNLQ